MNMSAYPLARLSRSEDSNDGYRRRILALGRYCATTKNRVKLCWYSLIVIDAIQTESKILH
jgi:hypothetical protein